MTLLIAFLHYVRRFTKPWAHEEIDQLIRLFESVRAMPRSTALAVLLATALTLMFKAMAVTALTLLLCACWLTQKAAASPGVNTP